MPNFTITKKDGSKVCVEASNLKAAEKKAKKYDGKVTHVGIDKPKKKAKKED